MLDDLQTADQEITHAERRVCRIHDWLLGTLQDNRITAWADELIRPEDAGEPIFGASAVLVEPDRWASLEIDYRSAAARSVDYGWSIKRVIEVVGRLILTDLTLDGAQLAAELNTIAKPSPHSRAMLNTQLVITTGGDGHDECRICHNGESPVTIDLKRCQKIKRAMLAFEILLRNPNKNIAYHLIAVLDWRATNTRKQSKEEWKKSQRLLKDIQPLGKGVYDNAVSLDVAHDNLLKILLVTEDLSLRTGATWSPDFKKANGTAVRKKRTKAYGRVGEYMRKSLKDGIEAVRKAGATGAAAFLKERIKLGTDVVRFE